VNGLDFAIIVFAAFALLWGSLEHWWPE